MAHGFLLVVFGNFLHSRDKICIPLIPSLSNSCFSMSKIPRPRPKIGSRETQVSATRIDGVAFRHPLFL